MERQRVRVKAAPARRMPEVVPFTPWECAPNPKVVGMISAMLDKAQSGEVQAFAFVAVRKDRGTITGFAGGFTTTLQGATLELQHRMITEDL